MPVSSSWFIVLFKSSVFLLVFCLVILSMVNRVLKEISWLSSG